MGGGASMLAAANNTLIKTVVGLAPAETNPSAIAASQNVTVPALIFSGSSDGVTPPNVHHQPIYNGLSSGCKSYVSIVGGAHCYFANTNFNCDFGEATSSSGISISRSQQQALTFERLDPWFEFHLKLNCSSYADFHTAIESSPAQATSNTSCSVNPIPSINQLGNNLTCSVPGYSYQWFLDGSLIPTATSQSIAITQNGTYSVEVQFNDLCTETSPPFLVASLGMVYLSNFISVYPNPFTNELVVQGIDKNGLVELVQSDGTVVYKGGCEELNDLGHLSSGIYMLYIGDVRIKVVK